MTAFGESGTPFANTVTKVYPGLWVNSSPTQSIDYFFDAFQLEEVPSDVHTPSEFKEPSESKAIIFGREITDGKIVTQFYASDPQSIGYGPQANVTPTGLPNPEPHGDFLIDTSNNNVMFRYHQKIPSARTFDADNSTFAQTLIFIAGGPTPGDPDGWYAMDDPRTANTENWVHDTEKDLAGVKTTAEGAAAAAAAAQADADLAIISAASAASAADAELLVFFEASTNSTMYAPSGDTGVNSGPATGNGDIWIHVDQVYDADGNQNTGSIFFANLSPDFPSSDSYSWQASPDNAIGRSFLDQFTATGVKNWMPAGYSTWNSLITDYNIGGSGHNADTPYPARPIEGTAIVNTSFGYIDSGSL
jgi:hypothetical protein